MAEVAESKSNEVIFPGSHSQSVTELEAECRDPDNSSVGEITSRSWCFKIEMQN